MKTKYYPVLWYFVNHSHRIHGTRTYIYLHLPSNCQPFEWIGFHIPFFPWIRYRTLRIPDIFHNGSSHGISRGGIFVVPSEFVTLDRISQVSLFAVMPTSKRWGLRAMRSLPALGGRWASWKKDPPFLLFRSYRGLNATQLYGDYFTSHERRIPINQPGFNGK